MILAFLSTTDGLSVGLSGSGGPQDVKSMQESMELTLEKNIGELDLELWVAISL